MFVVFLACLVFFECYGDHRDLHVRTHSFPTRRASDLLGATGLANGRPRDLTAMGDGVTALAGKTSIDERRSLGRNSALPEVLVQSISEPVEHDRPGPNQDAVSHDANRAWALHGSDRYHSEHTYRLPARPTPHGDFGERNP